MEFFRAGEALMRSSQPLLLPFLTPTAYRTSPRIGVTSRRYRPRQWQCQSTSRAFSSSRSQSQQANAAAARTDEAAESPQNQRRQAPLDDLSALFEKSLDLDNDAAARRTPPYTSNTYQRGANPINDRRITRSRPGSNSVDQIVGDLMSPSPRGRKTPSPPSPSNIGDEIDDIFNIVSSMSDPPPVAKAAVGTNDPSPVKLDSTTGRVIKVAAERGVDAAGAFRLLGSRLARNNVKRDAQQQRFHERPGLRRKRLKSQRWRKRFKEAFQGTVSRVVKLKKQGW